MSNFLLEAGRQTLMLELQEASRLPERLGDDFIRAAETIIHCEGKLIVSGIGKSGHIGKKLAATFASTGTPAFFRPPGGSPARRSRHARRSRCDAVYLLLRQRERAGSDRAAAGGKRDTPAGDDRQIHLAAGAGGESSAGYRRGARSLSDASGADLQHRQHPDARRRAGDGGDASPRLQ